MLIIARTPPLAYPARKMNFPAAFCVLVQPMKIFRGIHHPGLASASAVTIGNFDGVHRGHQAMLELLRAQAAQRSIPSCVLTFEPHPRDYFARQQQRAELAPARVGTLRDKLSQLRLCGVDQAVVLPFTQALAQLSPQDFVQQVLVRGLGAKYVLVGDDFRFGARRAGDYALLEALGRAHGFDVARMNSYELHGQRVSSTAVRAALEAGDMPAAARLLGHPYTISGHVVHGRRLGRHLGESQPGSADGFRTLNLRFNHWKPAASGIFAVHVHGLDAHPLPGVANLGVRPSLDASDVNGGRVLLEVHCLRWPTHLGLQEGYGRIIRVELLRKLHDELRYASLDDLARGIAHDCDTARAFFSSADAPAQQRHAQTRRQTTRDRI